MSDAASKSFHMTTKRHLKRLGSEAVSFFYAEEQQNRVFYVERKPAIKADRYGNIDKINKHITRDGMDALGKKARCCAGRVYKDDSGKFQFTIEKKRGIGGSQLLKGLAKINKTAKLGISNFGMESGASGSTNETQEVGIPDFFNEMKTLFDATMDKENPTVEQLEKLSNWADDTINHYEDATNEMHAEVKTKLLEIQAYLKENEAALDSAHEEANADDRMRELLNLEEGADIGDWKAFERHLQLPGTTRIIDTIYRRLLRPLKPELLMINATLPDSLQSEADYRLPERLKDSTYESFKKEAIDKMAKAFIKDKGKEHILGLNGVFTEFDDFLKKNKKLPLKLDGLLSELLVEPYRKKCAQAVAIEDASALLNPEEVKRRAGKLPMRNTTYKRMVKALENDDQVKTEEELSKWISKRTEKDKDMDAQELNRLAVLGELQLGLHNAKCLESGTFDEVDNEEHLLDPAALALMMSQIKKHQLQKSKENEDQYIKRLSKNQKRAIADYNNAYKLLTIFQNHPHYEYTKKTLNATLPDDEWSTSLEDLAVALGKVSRLGKMKMKDLSTAQFTKALQNMDQWVEGIMSLLENPELSLEIIERHQAELKKRYTAIDDLKQSIDSTASTIREENAALKSKRSTDPEEMELSNAKVIEIQQLEADNETVIESMHVLREKLSTNVLVNAADRLSNTDPSSGSAAVKEQIRSFDWVLATTSGVDPLDKALARYRYRSESPVEYPQNMLAPDIDLARKKRQKKIAELATKVREEIKKCENKAKQLGNTDEGKRLAKKAKMAKLELKNSFDDMSLGIAVQSAIDSELIKEVSDAWGGNPPGWIEDKIDSASPEVQRIYAMETLLEYRKEQFNENRENFSEEVQAGMDKLISVDDLRDLYQKKIEALNQKVSEILPEDEALRTTQAFNEKWDAMLAENAAKPAGEQKSHEALFIEFMQEANAQLEGSLGESVAAEEANMVNDAVDQQLKWEMRSVLMLNKARRQYRKKIETKTRKWGDSPQKRAATAEAVAMRQAIDKTSEAVVTARETRHQDISKVLETQQVSNDARMAELSVAQERHEIEMEGLNQALEAKQQEEDARIHEMSALAGKMSELEAAIQQRDDDESQLTTEQQALLSSLTDLDVSIDVLKQNAGRLSNIAQQQEQAATLGAEMNALQAEIDTAIAQADTAGGMGDVGIKLSEIDMLKSEISLLTDQLEIARENSNASEITRLEAELDTAQSTLDGIDISALYEKSMELSRNTQEIAQKQSELLEKKLHVEELSTSVKEMKNNLAGDDKLDEIKSALNEQQEVIEAANTAYDPNGREYDRRSKTADKADARKNRHANILDFKNTLKVPKLDPLSQQPILDGSTHEPVMEDRADIKKMKALTEEWRVGGGTGTQDEFLAWVKKTKGDAAAKELTDAIKAVMHEFAVKAGDPMNDNIDDISRDENGYKVYDNTGQETRLMEINGNWYTREAYASIKAAEDAKADLKDKRKEQRYLTEEKTHLEERLAALPDTATPGEREDLEAQISAKSTELTAAASAVADAQSTKERCDTERIAAGKRLNIEDLNQYVPIMAGDPKSYEAAKEDHDKKLVESAIVNNKADLAYAMDGLPELCQPSELREMTEAWYKYQEAFRMTDELRTREGVTNIDDAALEIVNEEVGDLQCIGDVEKYRAFKGDPKAGVTNIMKEIREALDLDDANSAGSKGKLALELAAAGVGASRATQQKHKDSIDGPAEFLYQWKGEEGDSTEQGLARTAQAMYGGTKKVTRMEDKKIDGVVQLDDSGNPIQVPKKVPQKDAWGEVVKDKEGNPVMVNDEVAADDPTQMAFLQLNAAVNVLSVLGDIAVWRTAALKHGKIESGREAYAAEGKDGLLIRLLDKKLDDAVKKCTKKKMDLVNDVLKLVPVMGSAVGLAMSFKEACMLFNEWALRSKEAKAATELRDDANRDGDMIGLGLDEAQSTARRKKNHALVSGSLKLAEVANQATETVSGGSLGAATKATGLVIKALDGIHKAEEAVENHKYASKIKALKAAANAGDERAQEELFRWSGTHAKGLISIAAKDGNPLALSYVGRIGEVSDTELQRTSLEVLRLWLLDHAGQDLSDGEADIIPVGTILTTLKWVGIVTIATVFLPFTAIYGAVCLYQYATTPEFEADLKRIQLPQNFKDALRSCAGSIDTDIGFIEQEFVLKLDAPNLRDNDRKRLLAQKEKILGQYFNHIAEIVKCSAKLDEQLTGLKALEDKINADTNIDDAEKSNRKKLLQPLQIERMEASTLCANYIMKAARLNHL